MTKDLEALEIIKGVQTNNYDRRTNDYTSVNEEYEYEIEIIEKDLDRLEKLENIFSDSHICEIKERFNEIECSADKCENCPLGIGDGICLKKTFERKWELQKENQELKRKYESHDFLYQNEVSKNGNLAGKIFEKDLKIQKLEKTLEIIKNKGIDYHSISAIKQSKDYEDYLDLVKNLITVVFKFTKQEYELLKEVFCND